jgi:hypothetical protein
VNSSISSFDERLDRLAASGTLLPRRYIILLGAIATLFLGPLAASALFLIQSGELDEAHHVTKWLQRNHGIYGTALNNNLREIAYGIYNERKPDIIVMSSSRGVDFREEFFSQTFSCVCSIMSNVEEGIQFFDAVKGRHLPRVAVLALDYWWFSTTDDHVTVPWRGYGSPVKLTRTNILSPYEWIATGKLTVGDFISIIAGFTNISALSREPKHGVQAIKLSNGTRADGTWSPLGTVSNLDRPEPIYGPMDRIVRQPDLILAERAGRYAPDQKLSQEKIALLERLIAAFERHGTSVVLMLLPIVNPVVERMEESRRYQFVWELRERLARMGTEYHDFFDPRTFGGSACEFKDPHHGGNALFARMLKTALDKNPSSILKRFVNYAVVADVERRFAGHVVATIGTESASFHEADFLQLGCPK